LVSGIEVVVLSQRNQINSWKWSCKSIISHLYSLFRH
jgi:hypothetical protein